MAIAAFSPERWLSIFCSVTLVNVFTFPNKKALNQNGGLSVPCEEPHPQILGDFQLAYASVNMG